jgi:hypothetical protein
MDNRKKSLYVETTISSYATAKMSRDIVIAARQTTTILFWETERQKYDLFTSESVIEECKQGDPDAAARRLKFMEGIAYLDKTKEASELAIKYQELLQIPDRAKADCDHLAYCVIAKMDYLLSWNCTHLGGVSLGKLLVFNNKNNLWTPRLVTPEYMIDALEVL